jgi:hypothetical protein
MTSSVNLRLDVVFRSRVSPPDAAVKRPRTANSTRSTSCSPPPSRRIMERRRPDDQQINDDADRTPPLLLIQNRDVNLRNADQRRHDNDRVTPSGNSKCLHHSSIIIALDGWQRSSLLAVFDMAYRRDQWLIIRCRAALGNCSKRKTVTSLVWRHFIVSCIYGIGRGSD